VADADRRRASAEAVASGQRLKSAIEVHQPQRAVKQPPSVSPHDELDQEMLDWLLRVIKAIDAWEVHFVKIEGDDINLTDAVDLRDFLRSLRMDIDAFLLSGDSYLARRRPDNYAGLRSDRNPVSEQWDKLLKVLHPYCRLLEFMQEKPNSGADDPMKMREYFHAVQEDSSQIRQIFRAYGKTLRALVKAVKGL
jgi:hypothetical protein